MNRVSNAQNIRPFFGRNQTVQNSTADNSGSVVKTAALIGLTALGIIGASLVNYRKGKIAGDVEALKNTIKNLKSINVADFKKIGKFEKGKALIDGAGYTGTIITDKGIRITYKNGLLESSVFEDNVVFIRKTYNKGKFVRSFFENKRTQYSEEIIRSQCEDGTVKIIKTVLPHEHGKKQRMYTNGKYLVKDPVSYETTISPNGKVKKTKTINGKIFKSDKNSDMLIRYITATIDLSTGNGKLNLPLESRSIWHKKHKVIDGKKVTVRMEKNRILDAHSTEFNKKAGIIKKRHYKLNKKGKLIPTNRYTEEQHNKPYISYTLNKNGQKTNVTFVAPYNLIPNVTATEDFPTIHAGFYSYKKLYTKELIEKLGLNYTL